MRTSSGTYTSPVYDSGTGASDLTSISIPSRKLDYSMTYCWHVRHMDNNGAWSDWSEEARFTTLLHCRIVTMATVMAMGTMEKSAAAVLPAVSTHPPATWLLPGGRWVSAVERVFSLPEGWGSAGRISGRTERSGKRSVASATSPSAVSICAPRLSFAFEHRQGS